ncbi:hypothetical protein [Plantactinospora sp. B5E13]|uniref:hypothetical protein n=1 Tax=Plantactinospora sp. B5E13 TaxID=3153758 RepID=UPI00325FDF23
MSNDWPKVITGASASGAGSPSNRSVVQCFVDTPSPKPQGATGFYDVCQPALIEGSKLPTFAWMIINGIAAAFVAYVINQLPPISRFRYRLFVMLVMCLAFAVLGVVATYQIASSEKSTQPRSTDAVRVDRS